MTYSYWRGGLWLAVGCLGIGAAVISIRLLSWPIVDPVPTPDDLFSEWDDAPAMELGDARPSLADDSLPDLPPLPPIEFPAEFPTAPVNFDSGLAVSGSMTGSETTWAAYESPSPHAENPVWFAGTIEVLDDLATSSDAAEIGVTAPAGIRR